MLVFASPFAKAMGDKAGLVQKDKAAYIQRGLAGDPIRPLQRNIRPFLLGGQKAFFEADLFFGEETPDRRHAHMHATSGQLWPAAGLTKPRRKATGFCQRSEGPELFVPGFFMDQGLLLESIGDVDRGKVAIIQGRIRTEVGCPAYTACPARLIVRRQ